MTSLREAAQQALEALDSLWQRGVWGDFHGVADNLRAALAEPAQEPVAWMVYTLDGRSVCVTDNPADFTEQHRVLPLYTVPPQRKPLTDEEILRIKPVSPDLVDFRSGVRCAERAHGIKDA